MTRQSKNTKLKALAAQFSAVRKAGGRTNAPGAKHEKDWDKRICNPRHPLFAKRAEVLNGTNKGPRGNNPNRGTAGGRAVLAGAGGAAK
ncbi:hypothetical protein FDI24_gp181 [Acidovorax phage ACP17]|uniref:Uncharacterized protein n=1 Tax=Acidovorax phage ACP17 TaxID=2010329 RepID=A0A218M337_9CAUD|nr:hypothetical protein FDI24_gp181 [Acidovorax phage ACP17]ASD50463.1 hypothetical protein [Acidovorax phage ACP17]